MTFGNRGHNQPVLALASAGSITAGRVYVTRCADDGTVIVNVFSLTAFFCSQNHQYALTLQDPFPQGWEPFFINCNDSSVEGIKSTTESGKKIWGVQFHPESAGGPLDTIEVGIQCLCSALALADSVYSVDVHGLCQRVPSDEERFVDQIAYAG